MISNPLSLSFECRIKNQWVPFEVDCVSYERQKLGIQIKIQKPNGKHRYDSFEPVRRIEVFSQEEQKAKELRWKLGTEGKPYDEKKPASKGYLRGPNSLLTQLGIDDGIIPEVVADPTRLFCSFCHNPVDRVNASHGTGKLKIEVEEVIVWENPTVLDRKVKVTAAKVTACPACSTQITVNAPVYSEG